MSAARLSSSTGRPRSLVLGVVSTFPFRRHSFSTPACFPGRTELRGRDGLATNHLGGATGLIGQVLRQEIDGEDVFRSRINPAYCQWLGTGSEGTPFLLTQ